MRQIERSKTITYRWWRDGENEIKPEHIEALEERADERIAEMMGQGYTSGELNDNIHMTDDDPEDGVEYTGWWEVSTPNVGSDASASSPIASTALLGKEVKMDKHWCMCTKLQAVYRDCWSTCSICGGKDAYGKSQNRPPDKRKTVEMPNNCSH